MKGINLLKSLNRNGALAVLVVLAAPAILVTGCSGLMESEDIEAAPEMNATALKATIVGNSNATNFSHYLTKRFANKSSRAAADTKVIVITINPDLLDGSDLAGIKSVYESGGAVVLVDPAADKIEGFQDAIGHSDVLGSVGAANGAAGSFCDAYIFNNRGNHLVVDYTRSSKEGYTITEAEDSAEGSKEESGPESEPYEEEAAAMAVQPEEAVSGETETNYAPVLDEVIKWIENPPETRNSALSARAVSAVSPGGDITALTSASTYTRIFYISSAGTTYYDGSSMTGSTSITNTQYVWCCYSKENDKDYYLVQNEIVIPNSGMYRGIWKHYKFPLNWKECGLYMTSVSMESNLLGENGNPVPVGGTGGGATIPCSSPATANGTNTVSSGMNWTVGGVVVVATATEGSEGGSSFGALYGNVGFSKSTSYDIQDVSVVNKSFTNGANARFEYTTNVVSTYSTGSDTMRPPAALACNTAQFTHFWRWEISNPKLYNGGNNGGGAHTDTGKFGMCTGFWIQYEEAAAWGGSGSTKRWQLNKEDSPSNFTWWFPVMFRNM